MNYNFAKKLMQINERKNGTIGNFKLKDKEIKNCNFYSNFIILFLPQSLRDVMCFCCWQGLAIACTILSLLPLLSMFFLQSHSSHILTTMVEWLRVPDCDQHDLSLKPTRTCTILLSP